MTSDRRPGVLIAAAALACAYSYAYGGTLAGLMREWLLDADASYGLIVAGVAAAVAWTRRRQFAEAVDAHASTLPGVVLLTMGAVTYAVGQLGADIFLTRISFVLLGGGTLAFVAGARAMKTMTAPLVFLLIAIPLPALVVNLVTFPLQLVASQIAESALRTCSIPVVRDGNLLTIRSGTLEVAQACSGLRSLISLSALALVAAWFASGGWWRRAVIVLAAVPVAIAMNGLRVAATGIASDTWGRVATSGPWHELTGWITFVLSTAALAAVYWLAENSGRRGAVPERQLA